jgi:cbb3-type cytochrome oxidase cytochrome c subunit
MRFLMRGAAAGALMLGLLVVGCQKPAPPPTPAAAPQPTSEDPGMKVFMANRCANCHHLDNLGGGQAPDLTHVGARHDADWITAHVKDPQSQKPDSRMPKFDGKISDADLAALAGTLAAHK